MTAAAQMGSQEMLKGGNKDCLDAEQNAAMKKLQFLVIEVLLTAYWLYETEKR